MNFEKEFEAPNPDQYQPRYPLDFSKTSTLGKRIMGHFIEALRTRVAEEQRKERYGEYLQHFYDSGYDKKLLTRAEQLAEEVYTIHSKQEPQHLRQIDIFLHHNFNSLLDHFIIRHCKHLNAFHLPEAILRYDEVRQGEFELEKMIWDFLHFEQEEEEVFTDFLAMPVNKIKHASMSFLFPEKDEKILLICDQTVFGSCKEGFAMTDRALYWKAHFEKAKKVSYRELEAIQREKDWITINGNFFNVNPSLNIKMLKLLRKLRAVY
ncbi:MAG: hypothetical protein AAFO94_02240 [Bacteroidota bacterium]